MIARPRVLFPALALAAAIAWTMSPGFAQTAVARARSDQDQSAHRHGPAVSDKFVFGEPAKSGKVARTARIIMTDGSFEPGSLEVKVGETIRFVVTNKGEIDHDFTIGDAATQTAHRAEMVEMAEKGSEMHTADDPNAIFVKAGRTGTLIWKFTHAGSFEFDCNVPGHYEAGMTGVLSVVGKPAGHAALTP